MKSYHLSHQQLLVVSVSLLAIGLTAVYFLNSQYFKNERVNAAGINTQALTAMLARGNKLLTSTDQLQATAKAVAEAPDPVPAPAKTPGVERPLWQTADRNAASPSIPLSDRVIAYEAIQIDAHPTSFPVIGQELKLPLLKGKHVRARVEGATLHDNGDYSWRGHLKSLDANGAEGEYPVVMTYGENSVFATITTPEGSYSLESVNGLGWLYKNPAEPELNNPGSDDSLLPPQE